MEKRKWSKDGKSYDFEPFDIDSQRAVHQIMAEEGQGQHHEVVLHPNIRFFGPQRRWRITIMRAAGVTVHVPVDN